MREEEDNRLDELAAAVADGRVLDWDATESSARNEEERSAIRRLRAIAAIGQANTELTFSDSASESLSVRSLLQGVEDSSAPASWGSLRILERVGRGRFGDVYRAWDPSLDREVALKLLRRRDIDTRADLAVIEEGRMMARVRHPNVATIHGAQRIDGRTGLWMEFIQGQTLEAELTERGPFPLEEVVRVGIELCRALTAVHDANLVHRDVKAQNVMRDPTGRIVLGDFGTGQEFSTSALDPAPLAGTPAYLAPEVLNGAPATRESDIYSLGVLLFRLATTTHPVRGRSLAELRAAHKGASRAALRDLRPDFPGKLTAVIERALESQPSNRFPSAADMDQALTECTIVLPAREAARAGWYWFAGGLMLIALVIATLAWSQRQSPQVSSSPVDSVTTPANAAVPFMRSTPALPAVDSDVSAAPPATREDEPLQADRQVALPRAAGIAFVHVAAELDRLVNFRRLAPDGIHATCAGPGTALGICNLETGAIRTVRTAPMFAGSGDSLLSRDGKQLVYLWQTDLKSGQTLRLINVDGSGDRELSRETSDSRIVALDRWTSDASAIRIRRIAADGTQRFAVVPIDGIGAETPIEFRLTDVLGDLSPDGRYLVKAKAAPGTAARDLLVADKDGNESWLLQTPADEESASWTPDGKAVVFMSNAIGGLAVFLVRVENGRALGPPQLVQDFGRSTAWFRGHGTSGSLLVQLITHWVDAFRATVNLYSGTLTGLERLDSRSSLEDTVSPDWDPTGQRFAIITGAIGRSPMLKARVLIRRADGRLEKEVLLPGRIGRGSRLRWSPDGRHLAVLYDSDSLNSSVIDVLDIVSDTRRRIVEKPEATQTVGQFAWSADSTAIYYVQNRALRRRQLDSGYTTMVSNVLGVFDVGPDGAIALATQGPGGCSVRILRDQQERERQRFRGDCTSIAWSRDGRRLLVGVLTSREFAELWSMDPDVGDPLFIRVPTELIGNLSLGNDGSSLLFSAGNPWPEFWLLSGIGRRPAASSAGPAGKN